MIGHDLCVVHAGLTRMPQDADYDDPSPRRPRRRVRRGCSARTKKGKRCPNWALRYLDPPLCRVHATGSAFGPRWRPPGPADRAQGRQCTARTLSGKRCRRWALVSHREVPGTFKEPGTYPGAYPPPLCWIHAHPARHGRIRHGYYRRVPYFTASKQAAIAAIARDGQPLAAELLLVRLKLRGLIAYLNRPELRPSERLRVSRLIFRGVNAVARLLLAQRHLNNLDWSPGSAGGSGYLLARILDEDSST